MSDSFRDFVVGQLQQCTGEIRWKRMFGAVGVYAGEHFFAVIDSDRVYFKVDEETRPRYEAEGMGPARIGTEPDQMVLSYYEVPLGALEAPDELRHWVRDAIAAAQRAAAGRRRRRTVKRRSR